MKNVLVIIKKQIEDTFKNKTILIQFIMFPVMTLIMENAVKMDDMPEGFFAKLFAVMYVGMAPLVSTAAIISEEKEKNTLRVLMMANVKPSEYLAGVVIYVWFICMIGAASMSSMTERVMRGRFLAVMAVGIIVSATLGACIGIFSVTQMKATSLTIPCMMILSFSPMLSMFNDTIRKVTAPVFTCRLKQMLDESAISVKGMIIVIINLILFLCLFIAAYRVRDLSE